MPDGYIFAVRAVKKLSVERLFEMPTPYKAVDAVEGKDVNLLRKNRIARGLDKPIKGLEQRC
jgi:hypothetical protein